VKFLRILFCFLLRGPPGAAASRLLIAPPPRDEAELKLIPAAPLTEAALPAEIDRMIKALRAGLDADDVADADRVLEKYAGQSAALANAAAIAWVERSPGAALLLAAEAAKANPASTNSLNTLGALLANAGYQHKGIPLLQYLAARHPDEPTVFNNLGQAWFALGDLEQAERDLARCLALSPRFGAAHASLGIIAHRRGDTAGANAHFQAAVAANYSPAARHALEEANITYHLPASYDRLVPRQEYFSPGHFTPPRPPRHGEEGRMKRREIQAFAEFLAEKKQRLAAQAAAADATGRKLLATNPTQAMLMIQNPNGVLAFTRLQEARVEGQDVIDGAIARYKAGVAELKADMDAKLKKITDDFLRDSVDKTGETAGGGGAQIEAQLCADRKRVVDDYLNACADGYEAMESVVLPRLRNRVNTIMTNQAIATGGPYYETAFAADAEEFLDKVAELPWLEVVEEKTCEAPMIAGSGQKPNGDLPAMSDCPINIKADCGVAKIKIDCRSFGFDFKAGLAFSVKKSFVSGETTLTAGLGENIALGGVGSVQSSAQFVLSWDRNNNLSFMGVEMTGSASLNGIPGPSATADLGDGKSATVASTDLVSNLSQVKAGTTLGVSIGPEGYSPELRGAAAANVLGRNLFEAKL
jgi:tetratricopeptide (TPR) repeat protein